MRTTLTLDADVAALLARAMKRRKMGLKTAVNEGLRQGLAALADPAERAAKPFRTQPFITGTVLIPNLDCVAEVLAYAEGEAFK